MSSNWTETTVPTPSTHAATIDQTMTALRQETTSPSAEGRFPQQGRRTRDMEATSDAQQEDLTSDPEDEAIAASHSSAVQEASSSITATSPPLSSERIAYLLSDDAFSDHYALAGSEWGWGYGPAEAESSGSEAEANSGAAPSLDASSGTSASSASSSTQNPPQGNPSHACTICHKQFTRSVSFPPKYVPPNLASRLFQAKHARGAYEHASRSYA
ncbi:hypothetical protein EV121DRAFT_209728 [Schizophyllum commune]